MRWGGKFRPDPFPFRIREPDLRRFRVFARVPRRSRFGNCRYAFLPEYKGKQKLDHCDPVGVRRLTEDLVPEELAPQCATGQ